MMNSGLNMHLCKKDMLVLLLKLLALFSFRKEEVLRKVGDQTEVQCYIDISAACKIRKAEEGLTAIEAVERAFINKKDKKGQDRYLCRGKRGFILLSSLYFNLILFLSITSHTVLTFIL